MCSADLALEAHDVIDSDDLGPLDGGWSGHHGEAFLSLFFQRTMCCCGMLTFL